jgi:hypothetical protein
MALDFPNTPVDGQVYDNFIYDAAKGTWKSLSSGASPNYLVNPTITDAVITATATTPSTVPITVNGAASQTANLQEWKNSAGITLTNIDNSGNIVINGLGSTSETRKITINSSGYAALILNGDSENTSGEVGGSYIHLGRDNAPDAVILASVQLGQDNDVSVGGFAGTAGNSAVLGTPYNTPLYFGTNSIARVAIDSAGRVTMPYQPMISGQMGTFTTFSGPAKVPFDDFWISSRGISYNSSTRRFTVPAAGTYRITMNPFTNPSGAAVRIYIGVNSDAPGGSTHRGHAYKQPIDHNTLSLNSLVQLNANDYVVFYLASGVLYNASNDRFNQFSIEMVA